MGWRWRRARSSITQIGWTSPIPTAAMVSAGEGSTSCFLPFPPRALFFPARVPSWIEHGKPCGLCGMGELAGSGNAQIKASGGPIVVPLVSTEEASGEKCGGFQVDLDLISWFFFMLWFLVVAANADPAAGAADVGSGLTPRHACTVLGSHGVKLHNDQAARAHYF